MLPTQEPPATLSPGLSKLSRRDFLCAAAGLLASSQTALPQTDTAPEQVIDIHQHTNYSGRTHAQLRAHQRRLGVHKTVLLPAGSLYGLDVGAGGNQSVLDLAREYPAEFAFFANEVPDLPGAPAEIRKYLKLGALGIGEQKFKVPCDSPALHRIGEIAHELRLPVLLHFQHAVYNTGLENFHKTLEKFPNAKFIGHAQTWWANVGKNHPQKILYPDGKVVPGGLTDRLLSDYPNMFGDLSAGSGLKFLTRDEEHARSFLEKHQDKLMFGTDCNDLLGEGPGCQGACILAAVRRLAPNETVRRKILFENAQRVLQL